ncbi:MAG: hypothetical protein MJA30_14410, partial [Cytophagales bacterium]|nr:hypothetical protein [Cytophagales bacterium]
MNCSANSRHFSTGTDLTANGSGCNCRTPAIAYPPWRHRSFRNTSPPLHPHPRDYPKAYVVQHVVARALQQP